MKSKSELLRIIEQRDLDLKAEEGLIKVIPKMIRDAGHTGMTFGEIAVRLFPELPPAEREKVGTLLKDTYGRQLRQAGSIGFALDDRRSKEEDPGNGMDEREVRIVLARLSAKGLIVPTGETQQAPNGEQQPVYVARRFAQEMGLPLPPLLSDADLPYILPDEFLTSEELALKKAGRKQ